MQPVTVVLSTFSYDRAVDEDNDSQMTEQQRTAIFYYFHTGGSERAAVTVTKPSYKKDNLTHHIARATMHQSNNLCEFAEFVDYWEKMLRGSSTGCYCGMLFCFPDDKSGCVQRCAP